MKVSQLRTTMAALLAIIFAACAGSTLRSGVGEQRLAEPPFYAGTGVIEGITIGHLPIHFQRGAAGSELFDLESAPGTPVHKLLVEMNAYLDSLRLTVPLDILAAGRGFGTPPDVQFGCGSPSDVSCDASKDDRLRLAVARPSRTWIDSTRAAAARANAQRVLLVTLEIGNYWPNQKNLRGQKNVILGTGYAVDIPWLTALDKPVGVLQLTGALMDTTGRAVRIGAEGLLAKRTNVVLSGFGIEALISDEDVEALRNRRRTELTGAPLVWQVALRNLVAQVIGRADLVIR